VLSCLVVVALTLFVYMRLEVNREDRELEQVGHYKFMAVGDSITVGFNGKSYVEFLAQFLEKSGIEVNFVGQYLSKSTNTKTGPKSYQVQAVSGYTSSEILDLLKLGLEEFPDVHVLAIHAGTNDITKEKNSVEKITSNIEKCLSMCKGHTLDTRIVLLSTLIPTTGLPEWVEKSREQVNEFIRSLNGLKRAGPNDSDKGEVWVEVIDQENVQPSQLTDKLHPNDDGALRMATNFCKGLKRSSNSLHEGLTCKL